MFEEVPTLELENKKGEEIKSDYEEAVEIVWEDEEPNGKTLNSTFSTLLDNICDQSCGDVCMDDSLVLCNDALDECFFFWGMIP